MSEAEGSLLVGYMAWDNKGPGPSSAVCVHVQLAVMLVRAVRALSQAVATYLEAGDRVGDCKISIVHWEAKSTFFAA